MPRPTPEKPLFLTGPGTALHIEGTIFEKKEGIKMVHVPYPTGQTAPDLINGDLHFCSLNIIQARPMVKAGQIRPIIVTTDHASRISPIRRP